MSIIKKYMDYDDLEVLGLRESFPAIVRYDDSDRDEYVEKWEDIADSIPFQFVKTNTTYRY